VKAHPLVREALQIFGGRITEVRIPQDEAQTYGTTVSLGDEDKEVDGERTG
jgi:bifunctional DNase/RNase